MPGTKASGNRSGARGKPPRRLAAIRVGDWFVLERQPIAGLPQPPELVRVIGVADGGLELQARDSEDIIVLRPHQAD